MCSVCVGEATWVALLGVCVCVHYSGMSGVSVIMGMSVGGVARYACWMCACVCGGVIVWYAR